MTHLLALARLDWQRALIVTWQLVGWTVVVAGACILVGWLVGRWRGRKDPLRGNRYRPGKWNGQGK